MIQFVHGLYHHAVSYTCRSAVQRALSRDASIKLRNFKARYLTMKLTIREYSCLGKFGTMTVNHFDFVEFRCANFPKLE